MRMKEPPVLSISRIVESTVDAIRRLPERRSVFFGHSMGAILASETARRLIALSLPLPRHLIVSGRRPPSLQDPMPTVSGLPDADFIAEIDRRYGGIPPEILENPDVLALVLPGLRADMIALETFQPEPRQPLPTPISAFGGDADPMTPVAQLEAWKSETYAGFATRVFPGGHFYLDTQRSELLREISQILARIEDEE
jgi:medium-chain acyl-[acyl-carrier-protein] hydrolase